MIVLLVAWTLLLRTFTFSGVSASATEIPITFYTDSGSTSGCTDPSTTATNITLNINVCVVTPGLGSFDLQPFPCPSGSVQNYVFSDTACGQSDGSSYYRGGNDGHCYIAYHGAMAAIMLSCDQNAPGPPSSTTTINVGPVATGPPSPTSTSSTATGGSGGDGSSGSSSSGSSMTSGWNSLNSSTKIGIIVAVAVGISAILGGSLKANQKRKMNNGLRVMEVEAQQPSGVFVQTYHSSSTYINGPQ